MSDAIIGVCDSNSAVVVAELSVKQAPGYM